MKTENEIKALPLQERQKLVIELRQVKPAEKNYANAKAIIELITDMKDWDEPEKLKVKNISGHDLTVDHVTISADAEAEVYYFQYLALARFLQPDEEVMEALEERGKKGRAADAKEAGLIVAKAEPFNTDGITKAVAEGVKAGIAAGLEAGKKVAALLLFAFLLAFSFNAQAFDAPSIASLNGGTNNVSATTTNSYNVGVTNSVILTNANWSNISGIWTNVPSYTTNSTVTIPGVFNAGNYDLLSVQVAFNLTGAGTTACPFVLASSDDGVNFVTLGTLSVTPAGTATVTGITNLTSFAPGYLELVSAGNPNANAITNLTVIVGRKQSRTGP